MILMYNVWVLAGIWSFMIKQSGRLLETENYMQQIWQIFGQKIGRIHCLQSQTHFWYSKITEFEQNGHLQSGCIQEMVAYKKWSLWTGGHFVCTCVNMGCWSATEAFLWIVYVQYQHLQAVFWSWMTFIGCYVPQTCSLRYQGISTMKASLL